MSRVVEYCLNNMICISNNLDLSPHISHNLPCHHAENGGESPGSGVFKETTSAEVTLYCVMP